MAFVNATRLNRRKIFTSAYNGGQRDTQDLPATGLAANLYIRFSGSLVLAKGTGAIALNADRQGRPFGIFNRIQLAANSGTNIVDVTGFGLFLRNLMTDNAYPDILAANMSEAESGNPVYQWPSSFAVDGTYPVEFTLKVPIVNNDRDLVGLIMLQNKETILSLSLDYENIANLFTLTNNATVSLTGTTTVTYEYFSVPQNEADYPDLSVIHKLTEDRVPVTNLGDLQYVVPRGNIYMRMIHRLILNGAPAGFDDVNRLAIQYNQSETPFYVDGHDVLAMQRERYKRDLPKGVYVHDWTYQGQAGLGGARDLVNSRAITDFLSIINIASSATLGSNNNRMQTIREELVPLS